MNNKEAVGTVVSNKMDKTITVAVVYKTSHKKYHKTMIRTNKYYADDPSNECNIGDLVKIQETKPISKKKRWKLISVISKPPIL